ncbi:hypothetical protein [Bufonid herpesvirus 1]|uniref:hypothetical protein n=1 Tax=Bufonid herpesvirus 1 TaxID=2282206 RepID=UPI000EB67266|nr:hypothetical protein [Bufonid herpesvirus 1]AXF48637.1 hypothetical protein [Bufonid herpesvirus 1]
MNCLHRVTVVTEPAAFESIITPIINLIVKPKLQDPVLLYTSVRATFEVLRNLALPQPMITILNEKLTDKHLLELAIATQKLIRCRRKNTVLQQDQLIKQLRAVCLNAIVHERVLKANDSALSYNNIKDQARFEYAVLLFYVVLLCLSSEPKMYTPVINIFSDFLKLQPAGSVDRAPPLARYVLPEDRLPLTYHSKEILKTYCGFSSSAVVPALWLRDLIVRVNTNMTQYQASDYGSQNEIDIPPNWETVSKPLENSVLD